MTATELSNGPEKFASGNRRATRLGLIALVLAALSSPAQARSPGARPAA